MNPYKKTVKNVCGFLTAFGLLFGSTTSFAITEFSSDQADALIDGYYQKRFTSNGTFIVPEMNELLVTVVGGGGGGAINGGHYHRMQGGCGGGGGGAVVEHPIALAAGSEVPITIGNGGESGRYSSQPAAGQASSFGEYLIGEGGGAAVNFTHTASCAGIGGGFSGTELITDGVLGGVGGIGGDANQNANPRFASNGNPGGNISSYFGDFSGGVGGVWSWEGGNTRGGGGGGGASVYGNGGRGGNGGRNTYGYVGDYGGGGGGSGGNGSGAGKGGKGIVIVRWKATANPELNQIPVANADSVNVAEGKTSFLNVLSNDTDDDMQSVEPIVVSQTSHGSVTQVNQGFEYTPASGFIGSDSFSYLIKDNLGFSSEAVTVDIVVSQSGELINGYYQKVYTRNSVFIVPEMNELLVTVVGGGGGGAINYWHGACGGGAGGAVVEHPMTLEAGTQVAVTIGSGGRGTWPGRVDNAETGEKTSFGNYLVGEGGSGAVNKTTSASCVGSGGGFSGTEVISNGVEGGAGGRGGWANHDVSPRIAVNGNPGENISRFFGDFAGGTGGSWNSDNYHSRGGGGGGGASVYGNGGRGGNGGSSGYHGIYGSGGGGTGGNGHPGGNGGSGVVIVRWKATANPELNQLPVANADSVNAMEGNTSFFDVLSNDSDEDLQSVELIVVSQPSHGSVTQVNQGFEYTPASGFIGSDSFSYLIKDNLGFSSEPATVNILVTQSGELIGDYYQKVYTRNSTFVVPELNNLRVTVVGGGGGGGRNNWHGACGGGAGGAVVEHPITLEAGTQVAITVGSGGLGAYHGNVFDAQSGTASSFGGLLVGAGGGAAANFTLSSSCAGIGGGFSGTESISGGVIGGAGGKGGWANHDVSPRVAVNGNPGESISSFFGDFAGGTGGSWNSDNYHSRGGGGGGGASVYGNGGRGGNGGSSGYNAGYGGGGGGAGANGHPAGNGGAGVVVVRWAATNTAVLNDKPVAHNDAAHTSEDVVVDIPVLENDTDANGDSITISSISSPGFGLAQITNNNTQVRYIPNENYCGTDSFQYRVTDVNTPESDSSDSEGLVEITVDCVNDKPVANSDSVSLSEDDSVVVSILDNDIDVDGDALSVAAASTPLHGSTEIVGTGIRYTPAANYCGEDSFIYSVSDGVSGLTNAVVNINVACMSDAPTALADSATLLEDMGQVIIYVTNNDTDPDGDILTVTSISAPANGSITLQGNAIYYEPNPNFCGADSFNYTISDGINSSEGAVTVSVTCVNDAPVIHNIQINGQ